jgi:hypothetical protein
MVRLDQLPRAYPSYLRGFNLTYQRRNVVLTIINNQLDAIDIPYSQLTDMMLDHDYQTIYQTRRIIRWSLRKHENLFRRAREGVEVLGISEEFYSESDLEALTYGIKKHKVFLQHPAFFMD